MNDIRFFKVGGCVRDSIMGLEPKDIDFAVEAESFDAMRREILDNGGKIFVETPKFLTIRAKMFFAGWGDGFCADFVLCRKDGEYKDGRRPETVEPGTIFDDLARRDFTMNAIAEDVETGEIIDPHSGRKDIEARVIRCVGNPVQRFDEDKLRVFRAIRFAVTKGFTIDPKILGTIQFLTRSSFDGVATERIRDEMFKACRHDSFRTMELIFDHAPILAAVIKHRGIWFKPTMEAV